MTHYDAAYRTDGWAFDPVREPELFGGVLTKRVFAFIVDAFIVGLLLFLVSLLIVALGILTLGVGFLLFGLPLFALVALGYVALTMGGPNAATPGMRMMGITVRAWNGERIGPLIAGFHALLFWVLMSVLTPIVLVVGLLSNRRRLLHDMILGTVILNADPLARTRR